MDMAERRDKIVDLVNREGSIVFAQLKKELPDVSEMTLRTDLKVLDQQRSIIRVYGGARSVDYAVGTDDLLAHRKARNVAKKNDIALKAIELVRPDTTIFIDSGTTTTALATALPNQRLLVFTNSLTVAMELANLDQVTTYVVGGELNRQSMSVTGARAVKNLGSLAFDQLFLGVTSYENRGGFTCGSGDEAVFKASCVERADETVVLIDSTKEGKRSTFPICDITDVDCVVSDGGLSLDFVTRCEEAGVEVL
ncbi:DeoR family transcriptional regulator [Olsenella sp. HMSC062G07]|nr:DeoR family transcriptional regulator [Olsenella sp. HMSC062G07]